MPNVTKRSKVYGCITKHVWNEETPDIESGWDNTVNKYGEINQKSMGNLKPEVERQEEDQNKMVSKERDI